MRQKLKEEFFCTLDLGLFCELPRLLSSFVEKSAYWSDWFDPFPSKRRTRVGDFPGVMRVDDYHSIADEVTTWIAVDTLMGGLQEELVAQGKAVWGARYAENIENSRTEFRELCDELKIQRPKYKPITGVTNLRKYLQANEDKWIKIDMYRGDMESWHHENYQLSKARLDKLAMQLTPFEEEQVFLCDEPFPDSVEIAYDGYTVDGKYPSESVFGVEIKSQSYFCKRMKYGDFPEAIQDLNSKMAPVWEDYHCRSNVPIELRILKDGSYIASDPCIREGFPCFAAKHKIIKNWAEIYHAGARGEIVDPGFAAECAMELVISSEFAREDPMAVFVPPKYRDNVSLRFACEVNGIQWVLPQPIPNVTLGSIVVTGKTYEDCKKQIIDITHEVKGEGIDYNLYSLDEIKVEWDKLIEYNVGIPKIG